MSWNDNAITAAIAKNIRGLWAKLTDLESQFVGLSKQVGPAGKDGCDGVDGAHGRDGVDGIHGRDGVDGIDGRDGADGINGRDGAKGEPGKDGTPGNDGATGPMPKHQWRGSELRFQQTPKRWGKWTDLRGPAGASGGGTAVIGGGVDFTSLPPADESVPDSVVVKQAGEWRVAQFSQLQGWLGTVSPAAGATVNGQPITVNGQIITVNGSSAASATVNGQIVTVNA